MLRKFFLLAITLFPLLASGTGINSELKGSRVFQWGAEISRSATAQIPVGINEVVFTGLPADIDPNSLQVRAVGDFAILSVSHRHNHMEAPQMTARMSSLRDSLDYYKGQIDLLQAMVKVYEEEEALLIANKSIGGSNAGVGVADLRAMADFFRLRLSEVKKLQLQVKKDLELNQQRHARIRAQIGELSRERTFVSEIVVTTSAARAVRGQLDFSYITRMASWNALYDIRAIDTDKPVELLLKASVNQNTGEDWNSIHLVLSTASPLDGRTAPSLSPWFLRFIEPVVASPIYEMRSRKMMDAGPMAELIIADDLAEEMTVLGYGTQAVVASQTTTTREFHITTPFNIKTGKESQLVEIQKNELPAVFAWYAVPRIDKDAYLVARVTGWEEYVILPGEAGIFFENAYVGKTFLNPANATDTLEVSMGNDRGVVIERVRLAEFSRKGILGRRTTETVAWEMKFRNNKNRDINLEIKDQIPVSTHADLQVTLEEKSGADHQEDNGILTWRLTLPKGESAQRIFRYSVRYPSDKKILLE
jgi:uncharacterized protein (TIGR02231 family)